MPEERRPEQGAVEGPGPDPKPVGEGKANAIWVMSNRRDNRVVLFERSPQHPYGEAFVGGPAPAYVGRTGAVEGLLREGLLIEVPEPADGPKKPLPLPPAAVFPGAAQPGQPIPLGRVPDPELWKPGQIKEIQAGQRQGEAPVPPGTVVPKEPGAERTTTRR